LAAGLPSLAHESDHAALAQRLTGLLDAALAVWESPEERRRMRAFGFRPAVQQPGVLKLESEVLRREWHGLSVRAGEGELRAARPGEGELLYRASDRALLVNGLSFVATPEALGLVEGLLSLLQAYERWVEAREGREGRLERSRVIAGDRRQVNALAETRRVQRMLQLGRRPPARPGG
jgi:hypothetical protein